MVQGEETSIEKNMAPESLPECCVNPTASYSRAEILKVINRTAVLTKQLNEDAAPSVATPKTGPVAGRACEPSSVSVKTENADKETMTNVGVSNSVNPKMLGGNKTENATADIPVRRANSPKGEPFKNPK
jgi:hypothetical protein